MKDRAKLLMKGLRYTLIELLVVISIISLLMTLLIPAMKHVSDQMDSISCLNNLYEQGIAVSEYSADNNMHLPISDFITTDVNGNPVNDTRTGLSRGTLWGSGGWKFELLAYLKDEKISYSNYKTILSEGTFLCPSSRIKMDRFNYFEGGYGWNWSYLGCNVSYAAWNKARRKITDLDAPDETIAAGDSGKDDSNIITSYYYKYSSLGYPSRDYHWANSDTNYNVSRRHNEGSNFAWADGHATHNEVEFILEGKDNGYHYPAGSGTNADYYYRDKKEETRKP